MLLLTPPHWEMRTTERNSRSGNTKCSEPKLHFWKHFCWYVLCPWGRLVAYGTLWQSESEWSCGLFFVLFCFLEKLISVLMKETYWLHCAQVYSGLLDFGSSSHCQHLWIRVLQNCKAKFISWSQYWGKKNVPIHCKWAYMPVPTALLCNRHR